MRWAVLGPTPGRQRSASMRRPMRGLSDTAGSERQLHSRREGHALGDPGHALPGLALYPAHRVVDGRREQVLEHVLVILHEALVDAHALDVVTAGHDDGHKTTARLPGYLHVRDLLLRLLQVLLHLLRLLHEIAESALHDTSWIRMFDSADDTARPLNRPAARCPG